MDFEILALNLQIHRIVRVPSGRASPYSIELNDQKFRKVPNEIE